MAAPLRLFRLHLLHHQHTALVTSPNDDDVMWRNVAVSPAGAAAAVVSKWSTATGIYSAFTVTTVGTHKEGET